MNTQKLYCIIFTALTMNLIFTTSPVQAREIFVKILHSEMKDWLIVRGVTNDLNSSLFIAGTEHQVKVDKNGQFNFKTNYIPENCMLTLELKDEEKSISKSNTYFISGCGWHHWRDDEKLPNNWEIKLIPIDPGEK